MLTEQQPSDALIKWAENAKIVKNAMDRPWFQAESPMFATDSISPACRCHTAVKLVRFPCADGAGYIYLGQCTYCQTIIWAFLECSGKEDKWQ
jgi:hypothetical protein